MKFHPLSHSGPSPRRPLSLVQGLDAAAQGFVERVAVPVSNLRAEAPSFNINKLRPEAPPFEMPKVPTLHTSICDVDMQATPISDVLVHHLPTSDSMYPQMMLQFCPPPLMPANPACTTLAEDSTSQAWWGPPTYCCDGHDSEESKLFSGVVDRRIGRMDFFPWF